MVECGLYIDITASTNIKYSTLIGKKSATLAHCTKLNIKTFNSDLILNSLQKGKIKNF